MPQTKQDYESLIFHQTRKTPKLNNQYPPFPIRQSKDSSQGPQNEENIKAIHNRAVAESWKSKQLKQKKCMPSFASMQGKYKTMIFETIVLGLDIEPTDLQVDAQKSQ